MTGDVPTPPSPGPRRGPRTAIAIAVAVLLVGAGIAIPLATGGGDTPGGSTAVDLPASCERAGRIDLGGASKARQWKRLAVTEPAQCFKLTAARRDAAGVARDSSFTLTTTVRTDVAAVTARLQVSPALPFRVVPLGVAGTGESAASGGTTFRITPERPMRPDTTYRFRLLDEAGDAPVASWAFQSQGRLRVVETLPDDEATDVPTDVGIELTFSHDGTSGVAERFSIQPKVEGRFETHKRVVVFVPKRLAPRTLYRVSLAAGVTIPGSDLRTTAPFRFAFETGAGGRDEQTVPGISFSRTVWESGTRERPALGMFLPEDGATEEGEKRPPGRPLDFAVRRFASLEDFLGALRRFTSIPEWTRFAREDFLVDAGDLAAVTTFRASPSPLSSYGYYVQLPSALAAGFYLVEARRGPATAQAWLQVTDVAVYASASESRTLVWANDVASGRPIGGASVRVAGGDVVASTGPDGVAVFDTPRSLVRAAGPGRYDTASIRGDIVVADGARSAVAPLSGVDAGESFTYHEFSGDVSSYWRFLYTDRHLYRPDDTASFWGMIRPREGAPRSLAVTVRIGTYDEDGTRVEVASTSVRTTPSGTFIGRLPFESASPGYYDLSAAVEGRTVASTSVQVEDYVKPAYKIDVTSPVRAVFAGARVRFDVSTAFFEGTPVPAVELKYGDLYDESATERLTTDARGRASLTRLTRGGEYSSYSIYGFEEVAVAPVRAEEGEITGGGSVQVFNSGLAVEGVESSLTAGRATVTGALERVTLERINGGGDAEDWRAGPAPGRRVTAAVKEVTYRRVDAGDRYDFVAKRVVKSYRYEEQERDLGEIAATSDARGRFAIRFAADAAKTYRVVVAAADEAGREQQVETGVYARFQYNNDYAYMTSLTDGPYAIGDRVDLAMRYGSSDLPAGGANRYLFVEARNGIRDYTVSGAARRTFTFAEEHVPNVVVVGVRFTGSTYQESFEGASVTFDSSLRRLEIDVAAERARYRPGETARIGVRVTDRAGRPVRGAEVLLSAVDEAIYRLEGQAFFEDLDILRSLYEPVGSGILRSYVSHQYPVGGGAEQGGEGPSRDDLRDVALFDRVVTDAAGRASVAFRLPDNLTSWRVTTLAVGPGLSAGHATASIPVGLPMFVDVSLNDSYLTADRPAVRVRAFGDALAAGAPVTFTVKAPSLGPETLGATGRAFEPADIELPALREGTHRLEIRAASGGRSDGVFRTITVVPSRLLRTTARYEDAKAGESPRLQGSRSGATRVVLSDHNRGRYYPALLDLAYGAGDRLDQRLSRALAAGMLREHFGETVVLAEGFRASAYQTSDGGLALFPFAGESLALSARAAAVAPRRFGRQGLAGYFRGIATDPDATRERVAFAYEGLAALGEPVLTDVQRLAAEKDLTHREALSAGIAAAALGDEETAGRLYRGLLRDYGQARGAAVRLDVGTDQDDMIEASAAAAMLGAMLGDDLAPLLHGYTRANRTTDLLVALEQVAFLGHALPRTPAEPVRYSYARSGERVERTLDRGRTESLRLSTAGLASLGLRVESGTLGVATSFLEPFAPEDAKRDPAASLERTYPGEGGSSATVREDGLVRITLRWRLGAKAVDGCYQITDLLPSGLRAVTQMYARPLEPGEGGAEVVSPYDVSGQRVSFCVARDAKVTSLAYYARAVTTGRYTAEPAILQAQAAPESFAITPRLAVTVR